MDFLTLIRVTVRRWYVSVPVLLLASVGAFAAYRSAPPMHVVDASVILVPPAGNVDGEEVVNPYLAFTGALNTTADAVTQVLSSAATRRDIVQRGLAPDFVVTGPDDRLPVIRFTVRDPNPERATRSVQDLLSTVDEELLRLQAAVGAPPHQLVQAETLLAPTPPFEERGHITRAIFTIAGVGLFAAIAFALLVEGAAAGRPQHRPVRPLEQAPPWFHFAGERGKDGPVTADERAG